MHFLLIELATSIKYIYFVDIRYCKIRGKRNSYLYSHQDIGRVYLTTSHIYHPEMRREREREREGERVHNNGGPSQRRMKGLSRRHRGCRPCLPLSLFIDNLSASRGVVFVNKSLSTWNLTPCMTVPDTCSRRGQYHGRLLPHCSHDSHIFLPSIALMLPNVIVVRFSLSLPHSLSFGYVRLPQNV